MKRLRDLPPETASPQERRAAEIVREVSPLEPTAAAFDRVLKSVNETPAPPLWPKAVLTVAALAGAVTVYQLATRKTPPTPGDAPEREMVEERPAIPRPSIPRLVPAPPSSPVAAEPVLAPPWRSGFETGDLSEWPTNGVIGQRCHKNGSLEVVAAPVRTGGRALKIAVTTGPERRDCVVIRPTLGREGYYGAWLYFPRKIFGSLPWSFLRFRTVVDQEGTPKDRALFSLSVRERPDGEMTLSLYDGVGGKHVRPDVAPVVPVGRWVHFEAFLREATDKTGRVAFWMDGAKLFDLDGVTTVVGHSLLFQVGLIAVESKTPAHAELYVDDAAVGVTRPE